MTVLAQFSQRADMAAERHRAAASMADITISWSRLTCPALVMRRAAP
jgi:hypothetical protein